MVQQQVVLALALPLLKLHQLRAVMAVMVLTAQLQVHQ
jgi:hypothetical protein